MGNIKYLGDSFLTWLKSNSKKSQRLVDKINSGGLSIDDEDDVSYFHNHWIQDEESQIVFIEGAQQ